MGKWAQMFPFLTLRCPYLEVSESGLCDGYVQICTSHAVKIIRRYVVHNTWIHPCGSHIGGVETHSTWRM